MNFLHLINEILNSNNLDLNTQNGLVKWIYTNTKKLRFNIGNTIVSKKLKIALCISGQLRNFKDSFNSLKSNTNIFEHDVDIYVHTWNNVGSRFPSFTHLNSSLSGKFLNAYYNLTIRYKNPEQYIKKHYPNLFKLFNNSRQADFQELSDFYHTNNIVIDDEDLFKGKTNQYKMFYKMFQCNDSIKDKHFDIVIRIRPDLSIKNFTFDFYKYLSDSKSKNIIYIPSGFTSAAFFGKPIEVTDTLAIGIPEIINIYTNVFKDSVNQNNLKFFNVPREFTPHLSLTYQLIVNGVYVHPLNCITEITNLVKFSANDIYLSLKEDTKNRTLTIEDLSLLQACKNDLNL